MVNLTQFYLATLHLNDTVDGLHNLFISEYVKTLNVCMDPETADEISKELLASNHILCSKKGSRCRGRRFRVPVVDKNIVVLPVNIELEVMRILRRHANSTGLETEILLGVLRSEGIFTTKKALEKILERLQMTHFIIGEKYFKASPQLLKIGIPSAQYVTFSWSKTGLRSDLFPAFPVFRHNERLDRSGTVSNVPSSEAQLPMPSLPLIRPRTLPETTNPLDVPPSSRDVIEMEDEAPAQNNLRNLGNVRSGHFSVLDSEAQFPMPSLPSFRPGALPEDTNPLDVPASHRDAINEMEAEAPAQSNLRSSGTVRSGHFSVLDSEERSAFSPSISQSHPGPSVNVLHTRGNATQDDNPAQTSVQHSEMPPEFEHSDFIKELFDSHKLSCIQNVCSFLEKLRLR